MQFKFVCCIVIKILNCYQAETSCVEFLKYNLHKLIVAYFMLSVPNIEQNESDRIKNREIFQWIFSEILGLPANKIINMITLIQISFLLLPFLQ